MTLSELIPAQAALLDDSGVSFGHGTTNAQDEAAWLCLWSLGLPVDDPAGIPNRVVSDDERRAIDELVSRRIRERVPAAYLTQEAWLQGVPFHVDRRCIVPRSLIAECLAQGQIDALLAADPRHVLDLCTGNASLAVLCAMAWPEARIDATDLSTAALQVARVNLQRHALESRIELIEGDGLSAVPGRIYDLIVCNPPYVNSSSMAKLPAEYLAEPAMALQGGPDGMDFVRPLLDSAGHHLSAQGLLVLEIGHEREGFEAAFAGSRGLCPIWLGTSAGDDLVVALTAGELKDWAAARACQAGAAAQ